MKTNIIVFLLLLTLGSVQAQVKNLQPSATFYDFIDAYYAQKSPTDTNKQIERLIKLYGKRLSPDGDCSVAAKAQDFAPADAVWHYSYSDGHFGKSLIEGYLKISVVKDTLIDGKTCVMLKQEVTLPQNTFEMPDVILYYNNDTVYYETGKRFYFLYDFGAQIGDTWNCRNPYELHGLQVPESDTITVYTVTDTRTEFYDGKELRLVDVQSDTEWFYQGTIAERFGSLSYLFPNTWGVIDMGMPGVLRCYSDSEVQYTATECELVSSLRSVNDFDNISVSKINSAGCWKLSGLKNDMVIRVYSSNGQFLSMLSDRNGDTEIINLSNEATGIYFITVYNSNLFFKSFNVIKL